MPKANDDRKLISVRLHPDTVKAYKHAAIDADMTDQEWLEHAIEYALEQADKCALGGRNVFAEGEPTCDSKSAPSAQETPRN